MKIKIIEPLGIPNAEMKNLIEQKDRGRARNRMLQYKGRS